MTLLLKSMWRSVLNGRSLNCALRSRSLLSDVTELTRSKSPDVIMSSIKTAPSATEVLCAVQNNLTLLNHKHMMQAFRSLFELQKAGGKPDNVDQIVKDPTFNVLCQHFKKQAPALDVNEVIEAIKVLIYLRVPADSMIVQTLLQLIRCNINKIGLRQVMFLDFLMTRFDSKNHLVDALKLALPLVFQIHVPIEIDSQDLPLLREMLAYSCKYSLPDRCINNVVTALLLHDQAIEVEYAKSIIWSLCQVNCTKELYPTRFQLLRVCYNILMKRIDHLSYDEVLKTAARIKGRILEKHEEFYHEQLMDNIGQYVINNKLDFEKGLLIARIFSRIAHTHLALVRYLCDLAAADPTTLIKARPNTFLGFINCLSNNNFTPDTQQWKEIKNQILQNPIMESKNNALPWSKICIELASLGIYDDRILKKMFSNDYIQDFVPREGNVLDHLQILTLHGAVRSFDKEYKLPPHILENAKSFYPVHPTSEKLEEHLAQGLGGNEYVVRNVVLPNGFVADCLICLHNGYPVKLPNCSGDLKVPIERLQLPAAGIPICILNFQPGCYSMNSNRLRGTFRLVIDIIEKDGYAAVPVNIIDWLHAPAHEKTPYLMREVGYKCGEIGMKISVTKRVT